jgi:hypothetical protein
MTVELPGVRGRSKVYHDLKGMSKQITDEWMVNKIATCSLVNNV